MTGEPVALQALLRKTVEGYHVGGVLIDDPIAAATDWHPGTTTVH